MASQNPTGAIEARFHKWLKDTGNIPKVCSGSLPDLKQGKPGSWTWNPNISDPTAKKTCLPIYYFKWEWRPGPEGVQVHVDRSTMGGRRDESRDVLITADGVREL